MEILSGMNTKPTVASAGGGQTARRCEYPMLLTADALRAVFVSCADFQMRALSLGLRDGRTARVCWLDGLVDGALVSETIIRPLTQALRADGGETPQRSLERAMAGAVYSYSAQRRDTLDEAVDDLTHGCCLLLFDGVCRAVSFEVRSACARPVSEPTLEKSIKGARDSFVETLRVNTALVRRRLATPALKIVESGVGRVSHTRVALLFLEGTADPALTETLCARLDALDIDALAAAEPLEAALIDAPDSPFPQLLHTERPDRLARYLLEGRVGILVDGLPIAFAAPVRFSDFMRVASDLNDHRLIAGALTVLRWLALGLSLLLPALYVAVALYHQEMIPTRLLLSVIEAKRSVPFSTALEVLGMLVSFELLQEAGLHLPNPIGDTVSIIGALIVGQSAVEARIVSPIAIIVVAFAGIAGYTLPSQDLGAAVRLARLGLVLAAIAAGFFGVGAALCLLLLHLAQIDSLGLNYTAPLSDGRPRPLKRLLPPSAREGTEARRTEP